VFTYRIAQRVERSMAEFLFQIDQRVKQKETGRLGTVRYRSTTGDVGGRFYEVIFDDGKTERIAESELLPA